MNNLLRWTLIGASAHGPLGHTHYKATWKIYELHVHQRDISAYDIMFRTKPTDLTTVWEVKLAANGQTLRHGAVAGGFEFGMEIARDVLKKLLEEQLRELEALEEVIDNGR